LGGRLHLEKKKHKREDKGRGAVVITMTKTRRSKKKSALYLTKKKGRKEGGRGKTDEGRRLARR